ncbi:MAG TPA: hypothetical protein VNK67_14160 [Burkholderiales bacterium]|nr:hypothetical protein [Burkholderiales bacterium]
MSALRAFSEDEAKRAKLFLATQVTSMMGRKLEEGDWSKVYCQAKGIPQAGWSNLHIDVIHNGLGLEMKLLRIAQLGSKPLKSVCGTTLMHPAATRSIRIDNVSLPANEVMRDVFAQYADLIRLRTQKVQESAPGAQPDMRTGWLLWEDTLTEFLYFEEPMVPPDTRNFYAEWHTTPPRGARKASKSLWVYDKRTNKKRYSVTTSAGIKIQPYFDVPAPSDPNLYYFRVQSEPISPDTICLWVASSTANSLRQRLGSLDRDVVSSAIMEVLSRERPSTATPAPVEDLAVPIPLSTDAHARLLNAWEAVSDEHRAQLLLKALG